MGNSLSCVSPSAALLSTVNVLNSVDGHVTEFHESLRAAEVMLEHPNHFLIHSSSLLCRQRISALSADEELKVAHLYILLPMHKLHSRLSLEEISRLTAILSELGREKNSKYWQSKEAPLRQDLFTADTGMSDAAKFDEKASRRPPLRSTSFQLNYDSEIALPGAQRFLDRSKSWVPKLETIGESALLKA